MRALLSRPQMFVVAALISLVACIDRGDPTDPGAHVGTTAAVAVVAVRLPVASLEVGHVATAVATAVDASGEEVSGASVEWASSDTTIFTVSGTGQSSESTAGTATVYARKMGTASLYATSNSSAGATTITVTDSVPANILISPAAPSVAVGGRVQLAADVSTATGRALPGRVIRWTSTDTRLATVSSSGLVTGAATGRAQIIGALSDVADTVALNIAPAAISALSLTPATSSIASGSTIQFTAHATDADGNTLTGRTVGWSSSDPRIAAVTTSGLVTGGVAGTARITATSEGKTATATIVIVGGALKNIAIVPGSLGLVAGATRQLSVTLTDDAGNILPPQSVTWSTSSSSIGTVSSSGLVSARRAGGAIISAAANGVKGNSTLAVSAIHVAAIAVTPETMSLVTGGTRQLSATLTDSSGNVLNGQSVAWSSTNTTVATVSSDGLVKALHAGNATIIAAAGGATGTSELAVIAGAVSSITVNPGSTSFVAGASQQLTATLTDNTGSVVTGQTVTWSSSDASVVSVSANGLATGGHTGSATVIATAGGQSGSAMFAVAAGAVRLVTISPPADSLEQGKKVQLAATLTDVAGNTVTGRTVTWTTSNSSVATTTSSGLVSALAAGSADITATVDTVSKSAAITVTAAPVSAPTLVTLTVSPSTVTLAPGATRQFSVAGSWSDGSSSVPAVSYSATGGTITAGGLYTAGTQQGTFRVIATQQGGTVADTSAVTVASLAPTLTTFAISPKSSTLVPGGVVQFTASGTWSDGSTTALAATFAATGGTITPGGSYTSGSTPGTFRVVATQQGGTHSDTAAITITSTTTSPPPVVDYRAIAAGIRPRGFGQGSYTLIAPTNGGQEWYVATTGNDADAGTSSSPLRTIAKAAQLAHAGDVVTIQNGTYSGSVVVRNSGSSSAPIVFQAAQRGGVVLSDGNASFRPYDWTGGVQQTGELYVTLRGLIFRRYAANVLASPGPNFPAAVKAARGWRIEDCLFDDPGNTGIQIEGSYVAVVKSTLQYAYFEALSAWSPSPNATGPSDPNYHPLDGIQLIDLVLHGNYALNVSQPSSTADYVAKFLNTRGTMIDNMESYANNGPGFWLDTQNSNFVIQNSYFHHNKNIAGTTGTGRGVHIEVNWAPGLVLHNVFANNDRIGLAITNSQGVTVKENMFYADARCVELTNVDRGPYFPLQNVAMVGNQCALWTDFAGMMTVGNFTNPAAMNIQADNNLYQPGSVNRLAWWENTVIGSAYTITDLRQKYGWEQNGSMGQVAFP